MTTISILLFLILITLLFGRETVLVFLGSLLFPIFGVAFYIVAAICYISLIVIFCTLAYFAFTFFNIPIPVVIIAGAISILAYIDKKYIM